jgi:hypothetical protein
MPAAMRSSRKKAKQQEERVSDSDDENESNSGSNVEQDEEHLPPTASNEASSTRKHSREVRRKRREEIKSRTTGVGLFISTRASGSNKIVFGDNNSNDENPPNVIGSNDKKYDDFVESDADEQDSDSSDDDDDDDAVEEVKSSVARDKVMEQLARERDSSKVQKLQTRSKKRKTKTLNEEEEKEEDEFDEDFFAQVDSEIAQERKQKKMDKESTRPSAGRHTTFLSTEEEVDFQPIRADHNIELVVLGNGNTETNQVSFTEDKEEPSELSHLFARGRLADGKELAKVKGTKKKKQSDSGWKRSKKMNAVALGQAKVARRKGRGTAAANFVVLQSKVGN